MKKRLADVAFPIVMLLLLVGIFFVAVGFISASLVNLIVGIISSALGITLASWVRSTNKPI